MRICFITEGSYPYILGGVSSWIHNMIKAYPEHEFIIYAISTEEKNKGKYKYELPENVVEIVDVFLDEMKLVEGKKGKKYKMLIEHEQALQDLLDGKNMNWEQIFDLFGSQSIHNISEFFMSKNFFNIIYSTYKNYYTYTPFTEFIWTIRSIYVTLFYLLLTPPPKADIYHSVSTGYAGVLGSYGKYLYSTPFILSEHGIYTREREEEIIKADWISGYHKELWTKFFVSLSSCAYEAADTVTSLFEVNKELQIELGCHPEKIQITPNGIRVDAFEHLPSRQEDEWINIGSIARVVPIKDIKTMLLTFDLVKRECANARLYIMGPTEEDEEYYNECLNLLADLGTQDVYFTGPVNIFEHIYQMDILILTSLSEGQPLSILEGMAAKKPHVCTNVGNCRGLLMGENDTFGPNGYIEYIMDYTGLAQSILKLCNSPELRKRFGEAGYERVKHLFTQQQLIGTYRTLYDSYRRN